MFWNFLNCKITHPDATGARTNVLADIHQRKPPYTLGGLCKMNASKESCLPISDAGCLCYATQHQHSPERPSQQKSTGPVCSDQLRRRRNTSPSMDGSKKFTFKPERARDLVKLRKRRPQGTSRNRRLALAPGRSGTVGSRAKRRRFSQIAAHLRPSSANAMLCIATASTNLIAGPLRHLEAHFGI